VQYDGARFAGWQRQPEVRTVQSVFETVLERLTGRRTGATAAGRTDTGVHAIGQCVSFTTRTRWERDLEGLRQAFNGLLPPDIWVERVHLMHPTFDARRCASARRYEYVIGTDEASRSPFRRPYEWALGRPLDLTLLERAAAEIVGEHMFHGLAAAGAATDGYRCHVTLSSWAPRTDAVGVTYTVEADRFLHRMVRFLVGVLVDVGLGRRPLADVSRLLAATDNQAASPPAPPQGVYLVAVRYPPNLYVGT
jgi:tRNA pseudouridine38-40 synthase